MKDEGYIAEFENKEKELNSIKKRKENRSERGKREIEKEKIVIPKLQTLISFDNLSDSRFIARLSKGNSVFSVFGNCEARFTLYCPSLAKFQFIGVTASVHLIQRLGIIYR